jgi:hypothetical protein
MSEWTVIFVCEFIRNVLRLPRWSHSLDAVHLGSLVYQLHGICSVSRLAPIEST